MDDLTKDTRARWNELAKEGVEYSLPWLELNDENARQRVDPLGFLGDVRGKRVLCLAGGGGQQSAAFGMLGAEVTVFDLSDEMLDRDLETAKHYGHKVNVVQGDARDISVLKNDYFDIVWQAHSLTFIPDIDSLFDGVVRVLKNGGMYNLSMWNPLAHGAAANWTGKGYLLQETYKEGAESLGGGDYWDISGTGGNLKRVKGPREFRHTLTAIMNGLIGRGFVFLDVHEESLGDENAEPGSWEHFCSVAPPWLWVWAAFRPDLLNGIRNK